MVEPLAVAIHAVQASKLQKGDTALVIGEHSTPAQGSFHRAESSAGAGPIGCFIVKTLLAQGAAKVIVSEPSTVRREVAQRAGAHHVFNPMESDVIGECQILTGGKGVGVRVSFECSGVQKGLDVALGSLMTGGTCVNVAVWE